MSMDIKVLTQFPGYAVTSTGEVLSWWQFPRRGIIRLKPTTTSNGYAMVRLWCSDHYKSITVHRIVAKAFIANKRNYPQVNHKDSNRQNNHVENLEWCNASYNLLHAVSRGRLKVGSRQYNAMLTEEMVAEARRLYRNKKESLLSMAKRFGVNREPLYAAITGKTWKHVQCSPVKAHSPWKIRRQQRQEVVDYANSHGRPSAMKKFGLSRWQLRSVIHQHKKSVAIKSEV